MSHPICQRCGFPWRLTTDGLGGWILVPSCEHPETGWPPNKSAFRLSDSSVPVKDYDD